MHKTRKRVKQYGQQLKGRSRLTNGAALLPSIDHRSFWARRFRDLVGSFQSDLAQDDDALSTGQKALIRRASALCVELEGMEVKFAANQGATVEQLEVFQRATNSLRRVVETLGISRGRLAREVGGVTLGQVLRQGIEDGRGAGP